MLQFVSVGTVVLLSSEDVVLFKELENGAVLDRRIPDETLSNALELAAELILSDVDLICVVELRAELTGALNELDSVVDVAAKELDEWPEDLLDEELVMKADVLAKELSDELLSVSGQ